MWAYQAREIDSPIPCPYARELRAFAQEIIDRIPETATQDTFAQCQQSLLSRYQALLEQMKKETFHFPSARTGRHRCLNAEYEQGYHKLKNIALLREQQLPAHKPQPVPLEELLANIEQVLAESVKETPFGNEREEEGK